MRGIHLEDSKIPLRSERAWSKLRVAAWELALGGNLVLC